MDRAVGAVRSSVGTIVTSRGVFRGRPTKENAVQYRGVPLDPSENTRKATGCRGIPREHPISHLASNGILWETPGVP